MTRILLFCFFVWGINSIAQNKKTYDCPFTSHQMTIDGFDHENIWQQIAPVYFVANEKEALKAESWFKACWDEEFLYFFFWIEDKDISAQMTMRDDHLWYEEVMEIFLDADCNPKNYYEFEWNALNTLLDLYVLNPNCSRSIIRQWWEWDCRGIQSAVKLDGTINNATDIDRGWTLEVGIPFSEIQTAPNIPPLPGDQWKFDLTRREGTEAQGNLQKSSWLPPSCHYPLSFGSLIFKK